MPFDLENAPPTYDPSTVDAADATPRVRTLGVSKKQYNIEAGYYTPEETILERAQRRAAAGLQLTEAEIQALEGALAEAFSESISEENWDEVLERARQKLAAGEPLTELEIEAVERAFAESLSENLAQERQAGSTPEPTSLDSFRIAGFYTWSKDHDSVELTRGLRNEDDYPFHIWFTEPIVDEDRLYSKVYEQRLTIFPNTAHYQVTPDNDEGGSVYSPEVWAEYVGDLIKTDRCYQDRTFLQYLPLTEEQRDRLPSKNPLYYLVNSVYNAFEANEDDPWVSNEGINFVEQDELPTTASRFNSILLYSGSPTDFANILEETNSFEGLSQQFITSEEAEPNSFYRLQEVSTTFQRDPEGPLNFAVFEETSIEETGPISYQTLPVDQWLATRSTNRSLQETLATIIFIGEVKKLTDSRVRSVEEVFNGEPGYTEVLFYKVRKSHGGLSIGTYILPNTDTLIRFLDPKIAYDKEYTYEITTVVLNVATQYKYEDLEITNDQGIATVTVKYEPILEIVEAPYLTLRARVLDRPPISPDVNILPYKGNPRELLFLFNSGVGHQEAAPITLRAGDKQKWAAIRRNQGRETGPILFQSDDPPARFEIFRLSERPTSYSDFADAQVTSVSTWTDQVRASSAGYREVVEPNTKYWYTFRAVDIHGQWSNPSSVFQVELVKDGGTTYLLLDVVDLAAEENKKSLLYPFQKYLMIEPAFAQKILNASKSGVDNYSSAFGLHDVFLGVADETAWGKKYKLRFRSTRSNKMFDINVVLNNIFVSAYSAKQEIPIDMSSPYIATSAAEALALTLADKRIVIVPGVGAFVYHAAQGILTPIEHHPEYGDFQVVGHLRAADLNPTDSDDVVTADLPTNWAITNAETGFVKLTAGGKLQLHATDGVTGVSSESSCELTFTGLDDTTPGDSDRYVVIARHAWADDGSLAATNDNRADFSLTLSANDLAAIWSPSEVNAGSDGFSGWRSNAGAALASALLVSSQPRVEVWEALSWQHGKTQTYVSGVERFTGASATLGALPSTHRGFWTTAVEAPHITYRAANRNVASAAAPRIDIVEIIVLQEGL